MTNAASLLAGGEPGRSTVSVRAGSLARAIAIVFFAAAVLWPIVWVAIQGYTLTGMFEESVGYRYFYSLRKVYDPPAYLFTAQGQSIDVIQALIQIALTWLGFPPTQAEPRIDYFCYASMIVFQLFNISAFAWMIWRIESVGGIVLSALFWLVPFYEPHQSGIYTLLQPDYMTLECALALVAVGSVLRTRQQPVLGGRQVLFFGAFIGAAAATKITFLVFPASAFAFAVLQERSLLRIFFKSMQTSALALGCWALIALADSAWHPGYALRDVRELLSFMAAGSSAIVIQNESWPAWSFHRLSRAPIYLVPIYATPILALISVFLSNSKRWLALSAPLLLLTIAANYFLYKRDYPNSLIEAAWLFEFVVFAVAVTLSDRMPKRVARAVAPVLQAIVSLALCVLIVKWLPPGVWSAVDSAKRNTEEQAALTAALQGIPGKRLWLVPSNADRPLSIDSAIMKGGSGANWLEPDSPTLRAMFPERDFRFHSRKAVYLRDYGVVLFTSDGTLNRDIARMSAEYSVELSAWNCRRITSLSDPNVGSSWYQDIIMCTPDAAGSTS